MSKGVTLTLVKGDNLAVVAKGSTGHTIVMDGMQEVGGQDLGLRPMDTVLCGLGGCSLIDMQLLLKHSRVDYENIEVNITSKRADSNPKVFEEIHLLFSVTGKNLNIEKIQKVINLSVGKYCSVAMMLNKTATITNSLQINERA